MKKRSFTFILFLSFITSLIIIACQDENVNDKKELDSVFNQELFFAKKLKGKEFNGLVGDYEKNEIFLQGNFKLVLPSKNQLALYTETENHKHVFFFNGIQRNDIIKNLKVEKLYYLKNGILFNNKIFLGVNGTINNLIKRDLKKLSLNTSLTENNTSKMLIHKWFSKSDSDFKDMKADELITKVTKSVSFSHDGNCDAGGEGSTGCSLNGSTGCSVSCGEGYYACCVRGFIGDCHCHKESSN